MVNNVFSELGLTKIEIKIYRAILESGSATITEISKISEVKRTTIYANVKHLKQLGLILEKRKQGKRLYQIADPRVLIDIYSAKLSKLRRVEQKAKLLVPQIREMVGSVPVSFEVQVIEGTENVWKLKTKFFKLLSESREAFLIGNVTKLVDLVGEKRIMKYVTNRRRQMKNTKVHFITIPDSKQKRRASLDEQDFRGFTFLPSSIGFDSLLILCGTTFIFLDLETPVNAVLIENKEISYLLKFMLLSTRKALGKKH